MRTLYPPKVYIIADAKTSKEARQQLEKFMSKIDTPHTETITRTQFDTIAQQQDWGRGGTQRTGTIKPHHRDPTIVFDTFTIPSPSLKHEKQLYPHIPFRLWARPYSTRNAAVLTTEGVICKTAMELHCALGCIHSCRYCHVDDLLHIMLNLNENMQNLDDLIRTSKQELWKLDSLTDTIALEPELNASKVYVEYFSQFQDKYLLLYTKSDNVNHLLDLKHNGQTIISWTLSPNTVAHTIENMTPSLSNRVNAMKKCVEAGYTVRCRFQPIVPIENWKRENSDMIEEVLTSVQPDVIALKALAHMNPTDLEKVFEPNCLDKHFVYEALHSTAQSRTAGPLSPETRIEIYQFMIKQITKHSPNIPIALCTESAQVWKAVSAATSVSSNNFRCVCEPNGIPLKERSKRAGEQMGRAKYAGLAPAHKPTRSE